MRPVIIIRDHERGAVLTEYVIATAILLPVFVAIAIALQFAARERVTASAATVRNVTPKSQAILSLGGPSPDPSVQDDAGIGLSIPVSKAAH